MATYKLIQDIEAEDHILGPLTLRQFIFALIAAFCFYVCFISVAKHVPFFLLFFLPPGLFCAFFAFPWGGDQPTETWALAKLRFWFKPRRRVWNQSGLKELVTINVPKKVERVLTDNLSQTEVKSRLQALANTIDSRGWAIKNINAVGYMPYAESSDRLLAIPDVPPPVPDETPADDIMDPDNNPVAQQFQSMINRSTQDYRQRLMEQLQTPAAPPQAQAQSQPQSAAVPQQSQQWFMDSTPTIPAPPATPVPAPVQLPSQSTEAAADAAEASLSAQLRARAAMPQASSNLRTLQPRGTASAAAPASTPPSAPDAPAADAPMTASGDPAILSLSKNNDLNVATLAREAQRAKQGNGEQDEVVISLH